jgi:hypothetical protein
MGKKGACRARLVPSGENATTATEMCNKDPLEFENTWLQHIPKLTIPPKQGRHMLPPPSSSGRAHSR